MRATSASLFSGTQMVMLLSNTGFSTKHVTSLSPYRRASCEVIWQAPVVP